MLLEVFIRTWSLKSAAKTVSRKFEVGEGALRADWNRRGSWPAEVFEGISDSPMRYIYLLGIHGTLRQIERELSVNPNPSCRVGLLKTKSEILFKLIEVQRSFDNEVLLQRIEAMEKRLESLASGKQKRVVKRK